MTLNVVYNTPYYTKKMACNKYSLLTIDVDDEFDHTDRTLIKWTYNIKRFDNSI